jgi:methionyl-tRNA synthetase
MLHALGMEPPKVIFAHGWWVIKGEKMSKSKGNVVDPAEMVDRYGVDPYRYFLLREVQFGMDGAFSEDSLIARYNSDLANDIGNLLNRTLTMVEKYFAGVVPESSGKDQIVMGLKEKASALAGHLDRAMPEFDFLGALSKVWEVVDMSNKLIEDSKPWVLAKENRTGELADVIRGLLEALRIVSVSLWPFMPQTSKNIWSQLGISEHIERAETAAWGALKAGAGVNKAHALFPRIEAKK